MALPMLLEQNRSLDFEHQNNHKNNFLALSSYVFFFTYLSERRAPLETKVSRFALTGYHAKLQSAKRS